MTKTSVRYLQSGDILSGSGFIVTHNPYTSVKCPKGRLWVEGNYPGSPVRVHSWNASTTVTIVNR